MSPRTFIERIENLGEKSWVIPCSLFLASFLFRFYFRNAGLFHFDEVSTAMAVEGSAAGHRLLGEVNGRYGTVLVNLLFFIPYKALGGATAEKVVVFTAILSGALLAAVLYLLFLELLGDRAGAVLSALFVNFNIVFLTTSTTGKEQTHQLLFLALSLLLIAKGVRLGAFRLKAGGFLLYAASLTIHEAGIALFPVFAAFIVLLPREGGSGVKCVALDLGLFLGTAAIPFPLYLGGVLDNALHAKSESVVYFRGYASSTLKTAFSDLAKAAGPLLPLLAPGLPAVSKRMRVLLPLLAWLLLFFYYGNVSSYTPRYLLYVLVPLAAFAGAGAARLADRFRGPASRRAAACALALVVCGYGVALAYPLLQHRKAVCGPKDFALLVRDRTERDAVVITMDQSIFIEYYAGRRTLSHPPHDLDANRRFVADVQRMVASGANVYIDTTGFSYDKYGYFKVLMDERFLYLDVAETAYEHYRRSELGSNSFTNILHRLIPAAVPSAR